MGSVLAALLPLVRRSRGRGRRGLGPFRAGDGPGGPIGLLARAASRKVPARRKTLRRLWQTAGRR